MIHTDGRPTIANAGSPLGERSARMENAARDIAAAYGCTMEEAVARLRRVIRPRNVFQLPSLADELISDQQGLD